MLQRVEEGCFEFEPFDMLHGKNAHMAFLTQNLSARTGHDVDVGFLEGITQLFGYRLDKAFVGDEDGDRRQIAMDCLDLDDPLGNPAALPGAALFAYMHYGREAFGLARAFERRFEQNASREFDDAVREVPQFLRLAIGDFDLSEFETGHIPSHPVARPRDV